MMVGADPEGYEDAAADYELPEDRVGACTGIYQQADRSWTSLLKPHLRGSGEMGKAITVRYEKSDAAPEIAKLLQDNRFLEESAALVTDTYVLPREITFEPPTATRKTPTTRTTMPR